MRTHIGLRTAAAGLFGVALLAGCGGGGTGASTTESATGGATASESPGGTASGGASGSGTASGEEISTASTSLGTILVDEDGKTLYVFAQDSPGKSTCEGQCLAAWPPVKGPAKAGNGADAALLGTTQRSDGSTQVTYKDAPLYYYAADQKPGDTTGQGVGGVWWVVSPQGQPITGKAPASTGSSGY
ncbi:COG4315 family predicted lipoprotein [Georgenia thermotolerans]|uniref:Lipoprotein with Yx(FWY)xxD motif n=1 Tax=Georgenia thermotolerans TaxID=527326 RepID=A0A7J5UKS7_9MICO|nr:hypothetical protein [Georgenia thermotolerans]KAE8762744.1 hypothetical protein GB883_17805 [Georgenia thermotolerans]